MRLLAVELTRYRSRRAIVLLVLAAAVLTVVLAGATAWNTRPLSEADRTDAAAQADLDAARPDVRQQVTACAIAPEDYLGPDAGAADCAEAFEPEPQDYYPREPLDLDRVLAQEGVGLALVLVGLVVIAGCTFVGADWASGSLTDQLLFEPRRTRVWLAKAGAVALGGGAVTLVLLGGFWLALTLVAQSRGLAPDATTLGHVGWHVARATVLGMAAGLGAYALTVVFRSTVATLALLFVYSVGGEIAVNLLPVEGAGRWSVGNNAMGWLLTRHRYFDSTLTCSPGEQCSRMEVLTHLEAAAYLSVVLVVVLVLSPLWFRRRDV